jgi:hypothetical protein
VSFAGCPPLTWGKVTAKPALPQGRPFLWFFLLGEQKKRTLTNISKMVIGNFCDTYDMYVLETSFLRYNFC